jgi:chromosome segregation ATPase
MSEAQVAEVVEQPKQAGSIVTSENLAEFNADKLGLASESSPTAAEVDESPSEPAAQDGQSEPRLADDEATGTDEKKQNPKLEKRFSELTKARKEAEAQVAEERKARESLEARLAALEGNREPIQAPESNRKPSPDSYKDAFEYAEALAEWSAEQALAKREQEVKQKEIQAKRATVIQTWQEKLEATKAELPDYEAMVSSSSMSVNDTVRDAIVESDVGPRILYELASNDELAEKLSAMNTAGALKLIGKLEAQFEKTDAPVKAGKKTVTAKSNAPEPIRPLRSTSGIADVGMDGNDMSYQQWKAARQAGKIR